MAGVSSSTKLTQYDYLIKLLLIGDSGVGKSSLLVKFVDDTFTPQLSQTIGVDFKVKMLQLAGRRVKLQIWDTAGQERFHTITQQYYRNAMGIILVYDVSSEESFTNIKRWSQQVANYGTEGTDCLLIGNKADSDSARRAVDTARGQALAEECGMRFVETSAKTGLNVNEAFVAVARDVCLRLQNKEPGAVWRDEGIRLKATGLDSAELQQRDGVCCSGG